MGVRALAGRRWGLLVFATLIHAGCEGASPSTVAPTPLTSLPAQTDLRHQLAAGGYVIFFRHAARDTNAMTPAALAIVDNAGECVPGSELTAGGMADARALGEAFVRLHIEVDKIYASPTCRTTQMAALMFSTSVTTRALTWPGMWSPGEEPELTASLRTLLATRPADGRNTVLISHNDVLQANRVGVSLTLDQAEAAILRPAGDGAFELVGRITLAQWIAPDAIPAEPSRNDFRRQPTRDRSFTPPARAGARDRR